MSKHLYTIRTRKKRFAKKVRKDPFRYFNSIGWRRFGEMMCAPIRARLNYHEIGKKLLMVDELPQGAFPVRQDLSVLGDYKTKVLVVSKEDGDG